MLKKSIKFPLLMQSGAKVRSIEELRENFDLDSVIELFFDGRLKTWLEQRFYKKELEQIESIKDIPIKEAEVIVEKLFEIFDVPFSKDSLVVSHIIKRRQKIEMLKQMSNTELYDVEQVAISQDELESILSKDNYIHKIYLLGEQFIVNDRTENVEYIGINQPIVKLIGKEKFNGKNISFVNVVLIADSEIKIKTNQDLAKLNKLDKKVKVYRGFEKLKNVVDISRLSVSKPYGGLVIGQIFIGEKIALVNDERKYIIVVEPNGNKVNKVINNSTVANSEFSSEWKAINAICKSKTGDLFYYYKSGWGDNYTNLLRLDNKEYEECVVVNDFYYVIDTPTTLEFFEDKVYSWRMKGKSWENKFIEIWTYDINTGSEIEKSQFDLGYPGAIDRFCQLFSEGKSYIYNYEEGILISNDNKHINLDSNGEISDVIITHDKVITTPSLSRIGNNVSQSVKFLFQTINRDSSERGYIWVFDLNSGHKRKEIKAHNDDINLIKQFDGIFITMTHKGEIKVWDSNDLSLLSNIQLPQKKYENDFRIDIDITGENMAVLYDRKVFIYSN